MPVPTPTPTLHLTPRSILRAVVVVGVALAVFVVASRATATLWWFVQAAVLAALAYPAVQRMSRPMPAFVAFLLLTAVVSAFVAFPAGAQAAAVEGVNKVIQEWQVN